MALVGCGSGGDIPPPPPPPPAPVAPAGTPFAMGAVRPSDAEIASRQLGYSASFAKLSASLPTSVDLTTSGFLPSPGNQGFQPSCVAWAVGYGMASYVAAKAAATRVGSSSDEASPSDLYAKLVAELKTSCDEGTQIKTAMDIVTREGLASLAEVPYRDNACQQPQSSRRFSITGYNAVSTQDLTALKRELADGKVLPFGAGVYSDFFNVTNNVYIRTSGDFKGNHAMLLVGYDDARSAFRILNSWGNWGDSGYCWMSYQTFTEVAFEAFSPAGADPTPPPGPSPTPPSPPSPPSPAPSPPAPQPAVLPAFAAVGGFTTYDFFYARAVLLMQFQLSAPMLVETVEIVYLPGAFSFGVAPLNQWVVQSYFTLSNPNVPPGNTYFPGQYELRLSGRSQDGQPVNISASAFVVQR